MNSSYKHSLAMLPDLTLKVPLLQAQPKVDANISPFTIITKQCWQVDPSCSETIYRPMVSKTSLIFSECIPQHQPRVSSSRDNLQLIQSSQDEPIICTAYGHGAFKVNVQDFATIELANKHPLLHLHVTSCIALSSPSLFSFWEVWSGHTFLFPHSFTPDFFATEILLPSFRVNAHVKVTHGLLPH